MKYVSIVVVIAFVLFVLYAVVKAPSHNDTVPPSVDTSVPSDQAFKAVAPSKVETEKSNTKIVDGMKIETTHEGTGPAIINGQIAVVDYVGALEDGTVFDASKNHGGTFEFKLGAGMVIKGWDEGVLGMKVGESRTLTIPPELAYGPNGIPGVIPPNATLIFNVTLEGIK